MSVRVALLLSAVCLCAALTVKSSPEARFVSTEADLSVARFPASVLSHGDYAALKHEEAQKAVRALRLEGDKPDLLAELGIEHEVDSDAEMEGLDSDEASEESEADLLSLAAEAESGADSELDSEDSASDSQALEAEIDAVQAQEDSDTEMSFLEESETAEAESEDEAEEETEEEAEEESEEESEDEAEEETEDEAEAEDEAESEEEVEDQDEAESEDLALIEQDVPPAYISPELRAALPSKHNDAMPDKTYDNVAEKNLFPRAAYEIGVGKKPDWMKAQDAKKGSKKGTKAPKPAAAAVKKSRKSRKSRKAAAKKSRKARKAGRKSRKAARKSRKARKSRRARKSGKRGRKARKHARKGRKHGRKARKSRKSRKAAKDVDPRKIITAPYLQDIWDARHKQFVKGTNDLLNEVDDGILENQIHPAIADPTAKKRCKKGAKAKKF